MCCELGVFLWGNLSVRCVYGYCTCLLVQCPLVVVRFRDCVQYDRGYVRGQ